MDNIFQPVTEQRNAKSAELDRLDVLEIIRLMNEEDHTVAAAVQQALPQIAAMIEAIVQVMSRGGRLFYIGAGTSGRLGVLDASECPPTFGVDRKLVTGLIAGGEAALTTAIENAEDDEEAGAREIEAQVTANDAVVGIAASGSTPYVIGAIRKARELGALTASVACNDGAKLSEAAQYAVEVSVGPEVVTGSTRLKAGTATKMVLNMITTTAMIKLGKVYGNLMVNVQATNQKLRERVVRIVSEATGAETETASAYVQAAEGDARVAILMLRFGITREEASEALRQCREHFGDAVAKLEKQSLA
ncbi:N-acetylmuramic acid 6-phosphate etherase [Paenibacillus doosanensis]|uniref:N-acetylmuramic acid 6-phosphate etherase n=1 Tax=Paenibacillus doosanensis TaxID=1229154 RepID=UPI00217FB07B|nr:N-acetylmuramic acid 6-phosphate etherase [Paenibacillus doosanensis]MCS7463739.1 N-acetylmuramic acid 6-phosphate etherase [Paenibacillus doosanensis]